MRSRELGPRLPGRGSLIHSWNLITEFFQQVRPDGFPKPETPINWEGYFQPEISLRTEIAPGDLPHELKEVLATTTDTKKLNVSFGIRQISGRALLYIRKNGAKNMAVLMARPRRQERQELLCLSVFPTDGEEPYQLKSSPRRLRSLFLKTTELVIRCAELELRSRQAV